MNIIEKIIIIILIQDNKKNISIFKISFVCVYAGIPAFEANSLALVFLFFINLVSLFDMPIINLCFATLYHKRIEKKTKKSIYGIRFLKTIKLLTSKYVADRMKGVNFY